MNLKITTRLSYNAWKPLKYLARTLVFLWGSTMFAQVDANLVSYDTDSSTVTIDEDIVMTIDEVFNFINSETDFKFLYNNNLIENVKHPNISLKKGSISISKLLDKCLIKNDLKYNITKNNTIVVKKSSDYKVSKKSNVLQNKIITGTITDAGGETLPGATIVVTGTNIGTTADIDGNFSIDFPEGAKSITITYIGFATQIIHVGNGSFFNIQLEYEASALGEVVIVGYGTTKRENLTGSVDQINASDLGERPSASIVSSLQGVMPGLNIKSGSGDPTSSSEINVRGFNSINGGGPLVLIDGIEGNMNLINPLDVENITVLKDAASAAIYGARGSFGVILVTTKKGSSGDVKVNYSYNRGSTTPAARTDFISDPYLYAKTVDAAINGFNGTSFTGYTNDEDWNRLKLVSDGVVAPFQELQADGTYKFYGNTDWHDYLFKKWTTSNTHSVSVSGGNENVKAYFSGRYYNSGTIQKIKDEDVNRYNLKTSVSLKVNKWLEISENIRYNSGDQIEYGGRNKGWGTNWTYANNYLYAFNPTKIDGIPFDYKGHSTHASIEAGNTYKGYDYKEFINTISAKITPFEGLIINMDYNNRFTNSATKTRVNEFDYLTTNRLSLRTVGLNRLTEFHREVIFNAFNLYSTYNKTIRDDHTFKLMLGYNQEDYDQKDVIAEQGELFDPNYSSLNLGTEALRADGASQLWAVQGYFGRFNYDYKNRYLLELNARYDGSSRFPEDSRWGIFPSASLGWYMSRENFWQPLQKAVSNLKLRASYGRLGNQNVGLYDFSQLLGTGRTRWLVGEEPLNYTSVPKPLPSVVTWEKVNTTNLGLDIGFLENKITSSLDLYSKQINDMYLPGAPLPGVFGTSSPKENVADLEVKGFELNLTYRDNFELDGSAFNYSASFNVNNSIARIVKYPNPDNILSDFYEGQVLGEIWGYRVDGQFQSDEEAADYQNSFTDPSKDLGQVYDFAINVAQNSDWKGLRAGDLKYLDIDGDGEISKGNNTLEDHGDLEVIGNSMPKFPFGFSFRADWKGVDLAAAFSGVLSQDWYPSGRIYWGTYERPYVAFIRQDLVDDAWSPDNLNGKYPQISRGYTALKSNRQLGATNDHFLTNVGYLRMKNLTVGYTLPKELTRKAYLERVRFYFSGENILTFRFGGLTEYIDPEQAGSGVSLNNPNAATSSSRVENYPIGKVFSFGVNVAL